MDIIISLLYTNIQFSVAGHCINKNPILNFSSKGLLQSTKSHQKQIDNILEKSQMIIHIFPNEVIMVQDFFIIFLVRTAYINHHNKTQEGNQFSSTSPRYHPSPSPCINWSAKKLRSNIRTFKLSDVGSFYQNLNENPVTESDDVFNWQLICTIPFSRSEFLQSCPSQCKCSWSGGKNSADCSYKSLQKIPQDFRTELQVCIGFYRAFWLNNVSIVLSIENFLVNNHHWLW